MVKNIIIILLLFTILALSKPSQIIHVPCRADIMNISQTNHRLAKIEYIENLLITEEKEFVCYWVNKTKLCTLKWERN